MTRGGATILVVGDEEPMRTVVIKDLRKACFRVVGAANANEAMAILARRGTIDLILTDLSLPGSINGIGLARFVRSCGASIKIVFLSPDACDPSLRAWGDGFLFKPCDVGSLIKTLTNVLAVT